MARDGAALLKFIEAGRATDALSCWLDCATLGRAVCASRRARTLFGDGGPFAQLCWRRAADALDEVFPGSDLMNLEEARGFQEFDELTGNDPRVSVGLRTYMEQYPDGLLVDYPNHKKKVAVYHEEVAASIRAWAATPPSRRVALMATWQCAVAERIRDIPASFSEYFPNEMWGSDQEDPRFGGHYDYGGRSWTAALDAMILLAYVNVCEVQRHQKSDIYSDKTVHSVFVKGWSESCWDTDDGVRFWNMLTGDDIWGGDHCPDQVVSKGKAWSRCQDMDQITALAPLLGARTARELNVLRGVEDFPGPYSFEDIDWDTDSEYESD